MSQFFIERPVFASVLAIVITLAGGLALPALPVAQYPDITPPTVQVSAVYPGANAEVLAETVAAPIEEQVNGVEDMLYMSSTSSSNGAYNLTVTFEVGTDLDLASILVQNRVARAEPFLPVEVTQQGITTQKQSTNILLALQLISLDGSRDPLYMSNYATLNIRDELLRLPGVGTVTLLGGGPFGMRIWLDPARMQARGLTTSDIIAALREQNVQVAAGQVGQPPAPDGTAKQLTITSLGRLSTTDEFESIIVKTGDDSTALVRIGDVARVELGAQNYEATSFLGEQPCTTMLIFQRPGANALSTATDVYGKLDELSAAFPSGMEYRIAYDTTLFVTAAIDEVINTLVIAILLVFATVFVFLQDWRATLVPAVTIPVSLVGTFAVMLVSGFSVNMLTLFGLVLAIGIVVDDAIVVVENVTRKIEETGCTGREAATAAMREVSGPIIATTLVVLAVFVPAAMLSGITGQLYRQFALTICAATLFSSINALTLSPALCAILIRKHGASRFPPFVAFNYVFDKGTAAYAWTVDLTVRRVLLMVVVFVILIGVTVYQFQRLPASFLPTEDQGYAIAFAQLPSGASLERAEAVGEKMVQIAQNTPGISDIIVINGYSLLDGTTLSNTVTAFLPFEPWEERQTMQESLFGILGGLNAQLGAIPEARAFAFPPPAIQGLGVGGGLELQVQDRGGLGYAQLQRTTFDAIAQANGQSALTGFQSTFRADVPQLYADIDRTKVKTLDVPLTEVFGTMQAYLGSSYVNDFNLFGRTYRVQVQAEAEDRAVSEDIQRLRVRNARGQMVPLATVVDIEKTAGPQLVSRFNLYASAKVTGETAPGFSSADGLTVVEDMLDRILPDGAGYAWSGISFQEKAAGGEAPVVFALAILVVFLVLAAQYESWPAPISIILSIPLGLVGAVAALLVRNLFNDTYAQIGIVLLIALGSKNAILIVEFARELRASGRGIYESAVEASRLRLRAVLMTAISFLLGTFPLVVAVGAGAASRQALGTVVFGGMISATFLNVLFVPSFYVLVQGTTEWVAGLLGGTPASDCEPEAFEKRYAETSATKPDDAKSSEGATEAPEPRSESPEATEPEKPSDHDPQP